MSRLRRFAWPVVAVFFVGFAAVAITAPFVDSAARERRINIPGEGEAVLSINAVTQQAYLKPAAVGTTQANELFGYSIAVSGDTIVVGANREASSTTGVNSTANEGAANAGAAYVFVRNAGVWTQQAYLKPAAVGTSQVDDEFGEAVAISGDTIVVGAPGEDSGTTGLNTTADEAAPNSGAVYVFTRSAGVWTQQAYLKHASGSTTQAGDGFGSSVAIAGDSMIAGARGEDSSSTGVNSTPDESAQTSGAAYVFTRTAGIWSQQAYLKPAAVGTTQAGDEFGYSVAISNDTAVVGALAEDSSSLGVNSTPVEGASFAGAAYVFTRSAGVWTQEAYLKPAAVGTTQVGDRFGVSVAIEQNTLVVGAYLEDSNSTGVNGALNEGASNAGTAYIFVRSAGVWTQEATLKPSAVGTTQANDGFGFAVGISGNTVVVGTTSEASNTTGVNSTPDENAPDAGAAYTFIRLRGNWTQQAYLKPAAYGTTQSVDRFGSAVSVSGDTVALGARFEDSGSTGVNSTPDESAPEAGAAYVFAGVTLTASDASVSGRVLTGDGRGVTNAVVTITDDEGISRDVITGRRGSFVFDNVESARTYVVSVSSRRFSYEPQPVTVTDNVTGMEFRPSGGRMRKTRTEGFRSRR